MSPTWHWQRFHWHRYCGCSPLHECRRPKNPWCHNDEWGLQNSPRNKCHWQYPEIQSAAKMRDCEFDPVDTCILKRQVSQEEGRRIEKTNKKKERGLTSAVGTRIASPAAITVAVPLWSRDRISNGHLMIARVALSVPIKAPVTRGIACTLKVNLRAENSYN